MRHVAVSEVAFHVPLIIRRRSVRVDGASVVVVASGIPFSYCLKCDAADADPDDPGGGGGGGVELAVVTVIH